MVLSSKRKGEIALLLVKDQIGNRQMPTPNDMRREFGNISKRIGVTIDEFIDFVRPLYVEAMNKGLDKITIVPKQKQKIVITEKK